jgi:MFS family permease
MVLLVASSAGFGLGVLQVALPAASVGLPLVAGLAFTALAVGEVVGALVAGGRAPQGRPERAIVLAMLGMGALDAVAALVAAPTVAIALLVGLLGVATAVQSLGSARLLDRVVAAPAVTAAYAAQIAALLVGLSLGSVVAGTIGSMHALFVPAVLLPLVACVLPLGLRERGTRRLSVAQ